MITILALDMSSTAIGWVLLRDGSVVDSGTQALDGHIGRRCRLARAYVASLLRLHADLDLAAVESPVGRFTKAVIPQARVSGAVLGLLDQHEIATVEIAPTAAKRALTGRGNANKGAVLLACHTAGFAAGSEHAADAYAVALAASRLTIVQEAA
jgi:Holliday junction resolvasome RuvABC endonuclease subunit